MDDPRPGDSQTIENAEESVVALRHTRDLAHAMVGTPAIRARADQWEIDAEIDLGIAEELLRRLRQANLDG